MAYHTLNPNLILGYHGCDLEVGERILDGEDFVPSENDYDWLGHGIYFWESNPERALHFAEEQKIRGRIQKPFVIGAVLSIPKCIDTTNASSIVSIQKAYEGLIHELRQIGKPVPQNIGLRKNLDCAVIMYLHEMLEKKEKVPLMAFAGFIMREMQFTRIQVFTINLTFSCASET